MTEPWQRHVLAALAFTGLLVTLVWITQSGGVARATALSVRDGGALASQSKARGHKKRLARIPCATYDESVGQYGGSVFRLRKHPRSCVQYKGNSPCHCTESNLIRLRWRHWGSRVTTARGIWWYCGMGACIKRRAKLRASRQRNVCGTWTYTLLRMKLAPTVFQGRYIPKEKQVFRLPACETVFDVT